MTDTTHIPNSVDAPLVDVEFIENKHEAAFVLATTVLNAEANLPLKVETGEDLETLAKHVKDARSCWAALDAARKQEKTRYDDAGRQVQGLFTPRQGKLADSGKIALNRIKAYNRIVEERERQAAAAAAAREQEEATRRLEAAKSIEAAGMDDVAETVLESAIEAQASASKLSSVATGSASNLVRTQTSAGTVSSRSNLTFEIMDADALRASLGTLGVHFNAAHIEQAIRGHVAFHKKQGKDAATIPAIAGVRFYADRSALVR